MFIKNLKTRNFYEALQESKNQCTYIFLLICLKKYKENKNKHK